MEEILGIVDARHQNNAALSQLAFNRSLPMMDCTKEEWKRALGFIVAFPGEDQRMTVLRTDPAGSRYSRNVVVLAF